jgi:hypothetical protein
MSGSRYHARNLTFQLSFRAQQNDLRMRMICGVQKPAFALARANGGFLSVPCSQPKDL